MFVIVLFILILNIVSILLIYRCLTGVEKKERFIFLAAGIAIMYMLTSFVYWISTRNVEITQVSQTGKDLITFLFVPINGILILPLLAKSYAKYRVRNLSKKILINRGIVLGVFLLILLVIECIYFENIQDGVVNLIKEQNLYQEEAEQNDSNVTDENSISTNDIANQIEVNTINETNEVNEVNTVNELSTNSIDGSTPVNEVVNMTE